MTGLDVAHLVAVEVLSAGLIVIAACAAGLAVWLVLARQARVREVAARRLTRRLRAVSACNQALIHADDESRLLDDVCRVIVETGGYHWAWVGYALHDEAKTVRPVAQAGVEREYLEDLGVAWEESEAIRTRTPVVTRDVAYDRALDPWRDRAARVGYASSIALPLTARGDVIGALNIYSTEPDSFDEEEVDLLSELAGDLAFGIGALRTGDERELAVKALADSERQLSLVLNNVSDAVFAVAVAPGDQFRFRSVNRRFLDATGLHEDQVVGARVADVIPPPAHELVFTKYREAVASGLPSQWEEVSEYPSGTRVGIVTVVPVLDAGGECSQLVGIVHDVTEREQALLALDQSERKYRELVESVNSIILRWGRDGRVTFLNPFGCRFFGYASEEIVGRHVVGTIVPMTDSRGMDLADLMERVVADPAAFENSVNENMRRSGERVWVAWTNRLVEDADGDVVEVMSVGTDVTPLKQAEREIAALNQDLERRVAQRTAELAVARDRAESADRVKSAFLATMSHELRTPLNSIIGFTGIMLQELAGPLNDEQRRQLEMVRNSSRHLLALINDVLDISKIEAGQLEVAHVPFDLPESIEKVVGLVRPLAEAKGLALDTSVLLGSGAVVSDPRRVEQVLLNLLNNAVKFTEEGSVTLEVAHVSTEDEGRSAVRFRVRDTGIGIKEDDLKELFQPFRQVDSGLARQHEGTGLGLAICRRLADLLQGRVEATSVWGKGSVFTFTLPVDGARVDGTERAAD